MYDFNQLSISSGPKATTVAIGCPTCTWETTTTVGHRNGIAEGLANIEEIETNLLNAQATHRRRHNH